MNLCRSVEKVKHAVKTVRSTTHGISIVETCLLTMRLPSFRRRDFYTGLYTELGKSFCDASCSQPSSRGVGNSKGDYFDAQRMADELVVVKKLL